MMKQYVEYRGGLGQRLLGGVRFIHYPCYNKATGISRGIVEQRLQEDKAIILQTSKEHEL